MGHLLWQIQLALPTVAGIALVASALTFYRRTRSRLALGSTCCFAAFALASAVLRVFPYAMHMPESGSSAIYSGALPQWAHPPLHWLIALSLAAGAVLLAAFSRRAPVRT